MLGLPLGSVPTLTRAPRSAVDFTVRETLERRVGVMVVSWLLLLLREPLGIAADTTSSTLLLARLVEER